MTRSLRELRKERERMNERILGTGNLEIKRFFALDARTYEDGALVVGGSIVIPHLRRAVRRLSNIRGEE
jgi:hypothetical protein